MFILPYTYIPHTTTGPLPGGLVVLGGDNVSPLVEIGLTDLPKTKAPPPAPPLVTALH